MGTGNQVHWEDCNWSWDEDNQPWDGHSASAYLPEIYKIIGKDPKNRRDGLHLDSAYKSKCDAFLTSDKGDIWQHRQILQEHLGYKIFHPLSELDQLKIFIKNE